MPTDAVKNRTFREVFRATARYEIPFFQRGYAWEKRQWDQLFADLNEEVIQELRSGKSLNQVEHFFGPIVVLEKTGSVDLKEFIIIDGQQRITTAYLLLGGIKRQLEAKRHLSDGADVAISDLKKYLENDISSHGDDYLKLKVFSSKGDRLPTFRSIFGSNHNPTTPLLAADLQLYVSGQNRVDDFNAYVDRKLRVNFGDVPSLIELKNAILDCLKVVWIPLDASKDDPQAIFESLNDKGMPLRASELLCNYLFQPIIQAKEEHETAHNDLWLKPQRNLSGNDQFEDCLRSLFSINERKTIGKGRKVYISFKNRHKNLTAQQSKGWLIDIARATTLYSNMVEPVVKPHAVLAVKSKLTDIASTRMESSYPFVLSVLIALDKNEINQSVAEGILSELLVMLVRRKMTEKSTTQYDTMFPGLLRTILNASNPIDGMQEQFKKNDVFTTDQEFADALVSQPLYRSRDLAFTKMILIGIDRSLQSFGQLPDYSTVPTIEHTLPQTLDGHWRVYLGSDAASENLSTVVHTLGNLCLLSGPANSSAAQNPFASKIAGYSDVTALARDIKSFSGTWNIAAIEGRSSYLAQKALECWKWH